MQDMRRMSIEHDPIYENSNSNSGSLSNASSNKQQPEVKTFKIKDSKKDTSVLTNHTNQTMLSVESSLTKVV